MKTSARNITEALDALERAKEMSAASIRAAQSAQEELAKAKEFFEQLSGMLVIRKSKEAASQEVPRRKAPPPAADPLPIPKTVVERVLCLFREAPKELRTKAVVSLYEAKGWPLPEKGTLYNAISGTIAYIFSRKKILDRNENGYFLKDKKLSTSRGNP